MTEPTAREERRQQIYALLSDIAEIDSQIAPLEQERQAKRAALSELVAEEGGRYQVPGVARVEISAPSVSISYDRKAVDALVQRLVAAGEGDIAQALIACQKESARAGSLRVQFEQPRR